MKRKEGWIKVRRNVKLNEKKGRMNKSENERWIEWKERKDEKKVRMKDELKNKEEWSTKGNDWNERKDESKDW